MKVSIIIPCYNAAPYIRASVNSILAQTYQNFEILIVDDGSTDNSWSIVQELALIDQRIEIHQIKNSGRPSVPRNVAMAKAQGDYIAFLDADDLWLPQTLQYQVNHLNHSPNIAMHYGMLQFFGKTSIYSRKYGLVPLPFRGKTNYEGLKQGNPIHLQTSIIRHKVVKEIGYFNENPQLKIAEDYDYFLRIAKKYPIAFSPKILALYRVTDCNVTENLADMVQCLHYLYKIHNFDQAWIPQSRPKYIYMIRNLIHKYFMQPELARYDNIYKN